MDIIRFTTGAGTEPRIGIAEGGLVRELSAASVAELLTEPVAELRRRLGQLTGARHELADLTLHAPIDGRTEVWAAGVTYELSQRERMKESEGAARFYEQVYDAERPELFFKSAAWRVAGPGQTIAVRADSVIDVPEPELALVLNSRGEICGYTVCNDVSSRTIEGENPLYLPQAKIYLGACALGPGCIASSANWWSTCTARRCSPTGRSCPPGPHWYPNCRSAWPTATSLPSGSATWVRWSIPWSEGVRLGFHGEAGVSGCADRRVPEDLGRDPRGVVGSGQGRS